MHVTAAGSGNRMSLFCVLPSTAWCTRHAAYTGMAASAALLPHPSLPGYICISRQTPLSIVFACCSGRCRFWVLLIHFLTVRARGESLLSGWHLLWLAEGILLNRLPMDITEGRGWPPLKCWVLVRSVCLSVPWMLIGRQTVNIVRGWPLIPGTKGNELERL